MILVLTAGFGDGHNTAARSIGEAVAKLHPDEVVEVKDLITEVQPRIAGVLKNLYQRAITNFPAAWRMVYRRLERTHVDPAKAKWLAPLLTTLARDLDQSKPRLIISTYPVYAMLLGALAKKRKVPPLVTVITDSITVHPIWVKAPSDLYCVADEETREVVEQKLGIDSVKIRVTGFPVSLRFIEPLPPSQYPPEVQRLLYVPSTSTRRVASTLKALKPMVRGGLHLTIPVGKHEERLYHVLRRFIDSMPAASIEIIGWTNRMPELLRSHDLIICKAGGAIMHEVLAAHIPAIIDYVVPGQEEGNAELLVNAGCGVITQSGPETSREAARILANGGKIAAEMRERMQALSVPDAALKTLRAALEIADKDGRPS